jgi:NAD(P)-dependent dehydrogenase (short-subunit alcohol dehydrogenase family)
MTRDQKVAVITGGGRGMGAAIARELHGRGYALALMSPSGSAETLAEELGGAPGAPGAPGAVAVTGSTSEAGDLEALVAAALEAHGRIDAVVNHTGGPPKGDLLEISDDDWRRGVDLVLLSVVRMARLVTPVMERQGGGAILNITTFSAFEPSLTFPVSSVLRAGIGAYTKLYSDRYAKAGIRMNSLLPGFIDSLAHKPETAEQVPLGRIGTVEEIAKTAAFLLSDDGGYITGQNLRVDGGLTRHM